jgi:uncharacterized Tic20 family protein
MPAKKKISPDETAEPTAAPAPVTEQAAAEQANVPVAPVSPVPPAPPAQPVAPVYPPLAPSEERTWAMLSHLSVLVNLFTGFGGPIAAFIIYLVYKDRSRYVAYHSLQSLIFQLIGWFGGGVIIGIMWAIVGALSAILIGIVLIPFALLFTFVFGLLPLGALIYGIVGAVQTNQGQDFKYWLVGDWMRSTLTAR